MVASTVIVPDEIGTVPLTREIPACRTANEACEWLGSIAYVAGASPGGKADISTSWRE